MKPKISVIGAGKVGTFTAYQIVSKGLADVVLLDIVEGLPQGQSLDILESAPLEEFDVNIKGSNDYEDIKESDIVIITAGLPRKPGMSREDLLAKNAKIVSGISKKIKEYASSAIVIIVTNPMDIMSLFAYKVLGFSKNKVIGMGGVLDSARFRYFVAEELNKLPVEVQGMVIGAHGDTMVPLPRYCTVSGVSLKEIMSEDSINKLIKRAKHGGAEIVALLKTGSASFSPASAITEMVKAIIKNENKILPASVLLEGEYDMNGLYIGVPVRLNKEGISEIVQLDLDDNEKKLFIESAESVKKSIELLQATDKGLLV